MKDFEINITGHKYNNLFISLDEENKSLLIEVETGTDDAEIWLDVNQVETLITKLKILQLQMKSKE